MADKKAEDRFVQQAEGIRITNIPPENLAYILKRREEEQKKKDKEKE